MPMRPLTRCAALYALVELAAFGVLAWAVGLGATVVIMTAVFAAGVLLAASELKGQAGAARRGRGNPRAALTDGVLVGLGSFLVLLPGVVSTVVGALMLAPPTRAAMRPLAASMVNRGVMRAAGVVNPGLLAGVFAGAARARGDHTAGAARARGDYIDGEVLGEVRYGGAHPRAARTVIVRRAGL